MKRAFLVLSALVGTALAAEAIAQSSRPPASSTRRVRASPQTGYGVAINQPLANNNVVENPQMEPLIIVARCNATVDPKDIEGWVGQNNPTTVQNMVASQSGTGRQTITFVVPWQWYYQITVAQQPQGVGIPPGGVCTATAWWTD